MIFKLKSGTVTRIPHLKGKSEEEADSFLEKAGKPEGYNMRLIGEDWYLDQIAEYKDEVDDSYNTTITGYSLSTLSQYAWIVIKTVEAIEPEYYQDLKDWCNPQAYFFIGNWKDIRIAFEHLTKLN